MRYIFIFLVVPMSLVWGWYFLSLNDLHFGVPMLTREAHELVFAIYGEILGMKPEAIPPLLARACIVDTAIVLAIFALRKRRTIRAWLEGRSRRYPREDPARSV